MTGLFVKKKTTKNKKNKQKRNGKTKERCLFCTSVKEEFVFILDDFWIPQSLVKSSFPTLQALSVTRLSGPWCTLYLHHPSSELGYICYLPLASLFPTLISPLRLKPHPSSSCITQLWTRDKWKGGLFFSPQFSEMKMTSRSYPKFPSVLGLRKRGPIFIDFILSRCSSCICFF